MTGVHVYERIQDVDRGRWDALAQEPLTSHASLAAVEGSRMPGVALRYVVVHDAGGRWLAGAPLASIEIDAAGLTHGLFRAAIGTARLARPRLLHTRLCLCGLPVSVGTRPARIAPGASGVEVFRILERELTLFTHERGAAWSAFKEFGEEDLPAARAALEGRGYVLAPSEPNCGLELPWRRYEEFLAALRSHYRRAIRLAARRLADAGVIVDAVPLAGAYGPELHALYDAVRARATIGLEWLTPEYFHALGVAFGADAVLLRFRRGDRTIGWVALLVSGEAVVDLFHGIDYSERDAASLYFNQLAEVVRFSIARRAAHLSLGQSTLVAKTRFGGVPVPLWFAVTHRNAAVRAMLSAGQRVLFPAPAPIRRRVFAPRDGDRKERAA